MTIFFKIIVRIPNNKKHNSTFVLTSVLGGGEAGSAGGWQHQFVAVAGERGRGVLGVGVAAGPLVRRGDRSTFRGTTGVTHRST